MRISDWSSDVCSSDLQAGGPQWSRGRLGLSRWRPFSSRRTGSGDPDARSSGFLLYGLPDFRSVDDLSGSAASGREPKQGTDRAYSGWNDDFRALRARSGYNSAAHTSELQSLFRILYAVFRLTQT